MADIAARPSLVPSPARIRPIEWVLLGFLVLVAIKAGTQALVEWRSVLWGRTLDICFALACIELVALSADTRRDWSKTPLGARRFLILLLPFALAPAVLASTFALKSKLMASLPDALPAQAIVVVMTTALHIVGLSLPTCFLWLLAARDAQVNGSLVALRASRAGLVLFGRNLRDWGPIIILLAGYWWSASDVGVIGRDAVMEQIDRALLLGHDLFDVLAPITSRPLSEWFAFSYTFFAVLFPLVASAVRWRAGREALQQTFFSWALAHLIAYVLYTLVPVKGPLLYRTFDVPIELELFAPLKEALMDTPRVEWDCFPSLHTATTLLMAWQLFRWERRVFWAVLPIVVTIPFACIYLRYHWLADVLAGIGLAVAVAWITDRVMPMEKLSKAQP